MEKIMSKTNDTSRPAALEDHHTLADSEFDAVTGGMLYLGGTNSSAASGASVWCKLPDGKANHPQCW
jgi:hypothetical protein